MQSRPTPPVLYFIKLLESLFAPACSVWPRGGARAGGGGGYMHVFEDSSCILNFAN